MENKKIIPRIIRGTILNDALDFINKIRSVNKIQYIETIGNLVYKGSYKNLGFYDESDNRLIGAASLKIRDNDKIRKKGEVSNFTIAEDSNCVNLVDIMISCIELVFSKLGIPEYTLLDFENDKNTQHNQNWIKPINRAKILSFRSLVPYIDIPDNNIPTNLIENGILSKPEMSQVAKILSDMGEKKGSEIYNAKKITAYFLNRNPSVVTYIFDRTNLINFHKFDKKHNVTDKKITIARVELLVIDIDTTEIEYRKRRRDRLRKIINVIWQIEKIDQIIFPDLPNFDILFSDSSVPYMEYILQKNIPN